MIYYLIGAIILMMVGIVGVVLPALPGLPLMLVIALLFHFFIKPISLMAIIVFVLITAVSILVDHLSGVLGSKFFGATGKSMLFGFAGMIVGLLVFSFIGAILGLFLGILISELIIDKDEKKPLKQHPADYYRCY